MVDPSASMTSARVESQVTKRLCDLTTDDVLSVYHAGFADECRCGCKGRRAYNPSFIDEAREEYGPAALDGDSDSDIDLIEMVVRLLKLRLKYANVDADPIEVGTGRVAFVISTPVGSRQIDRRNVTIFTRKSVTVSPQASPHDARTRKRRASGRKRSIS